MSAPWSIRRIARVFSGGVTFDDGCSTTCTALAGARTGETWAVKHKAKSATRTIEKAVLLEGPSKTEIKPKQQ